MKFLKTLTVLVLSAVATSLFAETTARAFLTFSTVGAGATYSDEVDLFEDNNAAVSNTADTYNSISDYCVNAYAVYESANYSKVKIASLNNLVIKFKANNHDLNYKLTFANVLGDIILVNGNDTLIADNDSVYDIVCTSLNQELTFIVNPKAENIYPRTIAAGQWATICYDKKITKVEGAAMYELVKYDETKQEVTADPVDVDALVAGKAYLFLATADAQAFTYTGDVVSKSDNNGLIGTFSELKLTEAAWGIKKGTSSIYPAAAGSTVPVYCAYIVLSQIQDKTTPGAPARAGRKVFNVANTPTGMQMVGAEAAMEGKMMINGKLVIIKGGKMYNAQGMEL